ncbi:MAG: CRISPR-associated endonuclease Cas2 [Bacteroidales bacterium]
MISHDRFSQYQNMWVLVFFDLPTFTKSDRRASQRFRKNLINNGFTMFQFSIYIRNCASRESSEAQINRIKSIIPPKGKVGILSITDKQFGTIELFNGNKTVAGYPIAHQLELF